MKFPGGKALAALVGATIFLAPAAFGATVTGTVKGPDGTPFKGAFVEAQNKKTRITTIVLSSKDGRYHIHDLPAGDYSLHVRAIGYTAHPRDSVTIAASQKVLFDWGLQTGTVRWSDLSFYQGDNLLPEGKGKRLIERNCLECHAFQTKMAGVKRDQEGWTEAVSFMRNTMHYRLTNVSDDDATVIVNYLNEVFGTDSILPRNVADMPEYRQYAHGPFADEAMKIVYVTYEMPGPTRMPFSATPDKNGNYWIPYFSLANSIGRLDPKTGEIQEFKIPYEGTAMIHSAVPAPDGSVWLEEQATNRVGKWDPKTQQITEYQDSYVPGKEGMQSGGSKHTARLDSHGNVWSTGFPLTELDPKTGKFTHFQDVSPYGLAIARDDTVWFAEFGPNGKIGKVDPETGKVTKYIPPSAKAFPRRIQVDADGVVWFAEFGISPGDGVRYDNGEAGGGKIARFDPKTETFKEYSLPGPSPSPYAFNLDKKGRLWYSSMHQDLLGCIDPKTGQVVEYPLPFSENTMREFFLDDQGRMWWASPSNNKVGYFYIPGE